MRGLGGKLWQGGLGLLALACAFCVSASSAMAAAPVLEHVRAIGVGATTATLLGEIKPEARPTTYQFLYGTADCATTPEACAKVPSPKGKVEGSTSIQHVEAPIEGLSAATTYHFLLEARSSGGEVKSEEKSFTTYAPPFSGLPDGRVYEQASPVNKDAGDVLGIQALVKATPEGNGITFASTFGVPGGKGNGALPSYLATRGAQAWSTQGLLPPISFGVRDRVVGWSPDFSKIYTRASKLGEPRTDALVEQSSITGEAKAIGPYVPKSQYTYAGQSADGSIVLFESHVALTPGAVEGNSNLYAWERASEEIHLAGVQNNGTAPGKAASPAPMTGCSAPTASTCT